MTKILLTGGSGFIGTNLVDFFIDRGYEVLNIDILSPVNTKHRLFWRKADITNYVEIKALILGFNPDFIVHLAARTDLEGKSIDDYLVNTVGTENICRVLSNNKHSVKKVIFTSSMLVCKSGYIPNSFEDYCPSTFYGQSKVIGENIVRSYSNNLPAWSIIRPTSIWGPWFNVPYISFFHIVLSRKFVFPQRKACTKTYGYIENSSNQICKILFDETTNSNHEFFYIGDEPPINIGDWANEIAFLSGLPKNRQVPYFVMFLLGIIGDILGIIKINFPMTLFRLNNMTTNNIIPLAKTLKISGPPLFNRIEGTKKTLEWMKIRNTNNSI